MRRELTWRQRRGISIAAVLGVHAILVVGFIYAPLTQKSPPVVEEFLSTWILTPVRAPAMPPRTKRALRLPTKSSSIQPTSTAITQPAPPAETVRGTVDWAAEAQRAAAGALNAPQYRAFGPHRRSNTEPPVRQRDSPHSAGETYTDSFGSHVYWVSDRCYQISDPPLPGVPPGLMTSRLRCMDFSKPAGQLFKDSAAYKKNHPE